MNKLKKKGQMGGVGLFVMLFVGVIVAIAMLNPIADTTNQMTSKQEIDNQSISTVTAFQNATQVDETVNFSIFTQSAWKVIECPLGSVAIRNGASTALTADVDYTLDASNARYSLINTTNTMPSTSLNITYADYNYCADGYNTSGGARSIANITVIFSALIILGFVFLGIKDRFT